MVATKIPKSTICALNGTKTIRSQPAVVVAYVSLKFISLFVRVCCDKWPVGAARTSCDQCLGMVSNVRAATDAADATDAAHAADDAYIATTAACVIA